MAAAKIMVVEDEGVSALLLEEKLAGLGYEVPAVITSGEEAIVQVCIMRPDLILMDIRLAGEMDGVATAAKIQTEFDIPIIYLTAYSDDTTIARAKMTKPFGYLIKPFEERELRTTMEMALYKHAIEKQLKEREQWLTTTLRSLGDGVVTTDARGMVTYMNPVAEILTGWPCRDAVGQDSHQVVHLLDATTRTELPHPLSEALRQERSVTLPPDSILQARDGTERPIGDSAAPIQDEQGQTLGAVLVFRDMTLAQQMEQERLKTQSLESLRMLAGGIAHDFNNVLMGILGHISLAKVWTRDQDPTHRHLLLAEQGVERATCLSKQLLTFARGKAPMQESILTAPFLSQTISCALQGTNIQGQYLLPEDLWPLHADRDQIGQAINNLVSNAHQAMTTSGTLTVSAVNVVVTPGEIPPLCAGRYVHITVQDQGVGMSTAQLAQVFDPYFTTKSTGSGLGLTVTYAIVKRHGGYITVTSTLGVGTTFDVYLPAAEPSPPVPYLAPEGRAQRQGRLLVMDDDDSIRELAQAMLLYLGYEVETCAKGETAVEKYQQALAAGQPFDAVLLDLTIRGGMGGQEALQKLRLLDPQVKGIVTSEEIDDLTTVAQCRQQGFCAVLPKPYVINKMGQVVQHVLQQEPGKAV